MAIETKEKIRVVLADDHAVVRKGIREFLEEEGDIQVVGEATNGQEAIEQVAELRPDVAVLDIRMAWYYGHRGYSPDQGPVPRGQGDGAHGLR